MSVLMKAAVRVADRASAMGVDKRGGVTIEQDEALRVLLSGLPVEAEEMGRLLVGRTNQAGAAVMRGIDFGSVVCGALAECVLLGYYLAREEDR